jgi:hypothetical protein
MLCNRLKNRKFALHFGRARQLYLKIYRGVEQLVAHRAHNPKVVRSSRAPATRNLREI